MAKPSPHKVFSRDSRSKRPGLGIAICLIAPYLLSPGITPVVAGNPFETTTLLDHLVEIESQYGPGRTEPYDPSLLGDRVKRLADEFRKASSGSTAGRDITRRLNGFIFDRLKITASQDLHDPMNLLPSHVLDRKQGYCVGIATVYLLLAESLDLPVFAVATPSHLFLRYDDGATRINIETFQRGTQMPDEQYIRDHKIPGEAIDNGVFLRNLTTDEFLARIHNNLGVVFSQKEDYDEAEPHYLQAIRLHPQFPAALYNRGNDLLRRGDLKRAIRLFTKSLRLLPTDVWALNNRGLAYERRGKFEHAKRDFEAALRLDTAFRQAAANLARLTDSRTRSH